VGASPVVLTPSQYVLDVFYINQSDSKLYFDWWNTYYRLLTSASQCIRNEKHSVDLIGPLSFGMETHRERHPLYLELSLS
jgi:hypothetical protein